MAGREFLVTDNEAYRLQPCRVYTVTFFNGAADKQGVSIGRGRLTSTVAAITLKGDIGLTSQFHFSGLPFNDGFTVFPTDSGVTDIIIEYEDM